MRSSATGTAGRSAALTLGVFGAATWLAFVWFWGGSTVSAESFLSATYIGLTLGAIYAMFATGLVVVYATTGIFNFAQGAIGAFAAFLFWELRVNRDWHPVIALVVVVLVFAPLFGVALDWLLMRRVRTAPLVVQLMVTVGLMVFLLALIGRFWDATEPRSVPFFFGFDGLDLGPARLLYHRLIVIVVAVAIAVGLRLILHRTRLGVAMRAVVDDRSLAGLTGARPNVVSGFSWALGAMLASLGGVLIAPEFEFTPQNLNQVLIIALTAAAFGGLRSLPLTVVGALVLGLLTAHAQTWLDFGTDYPFATRAIAPLMLFAVVVALPQSRLAGGRAGSNLRPRQRYTGWWEAVLGGGLLILAAIAIPRGWLHFGIWDPGAWDSVALNRMVPALTLALIGTSLVPLTGWAGQVNFAPLAFAGFGAVTYRWLGADGNALWIPVVGLVCAPLGALVALPAARLQGLYLALMSLAFAQAMAFLFFPHPEILPFRATGEQFPDLRLFGYEFDDRRSELLLLMVAFVIGMVALVLLRQSRFGRRWIAIHDSQAAAATVGVPVVWTKVLVYAFSAAIAGTAGVFWATAQGNVDAVRGFDLLVGMEIVLLMAAAGMGYPVAGLFLLFRVSTIGLAERLAQTGNVPWLVEVLELVETFGVGLLAIGMVFNQRGAIHEIGRGFAPLLPWRHDAKEEQARERAARREPEVGELGLDRDFTSQDVVDLDKRLGIVDLVTPAEGYRAPALSNAGGKVEEEVISDGVARDS